MWRTRRSLTRNIRRCCHRGSSILKKGANIHPTAIVEEGAALGAGVIIGPFCHVGASVKLHDGVVLQRSIIVEGHTEIGARTVVHPFAVLGGPPQHLNYRGAPTKLIIGEDTIIREHVTINVGTEDGGGVTRVGDRGFIMIGAHLAHDCQVGDDLICANNVAVGGHVEIGDGAYIGGSCAVHQFCRIGAYSIIGGGAVVTTDVIPYGSAVGNRAQLGGLNVIGLKRRGVERSKIRELRNAYHVLFSDEGTLIERVERVQQEFQHSDEVQRIVEFIAADADRPVMTPRRQH